MLLYHDLHYKTTAHGNEERFERFDPDEKVVSPSFSSWQ